MQPPDIPANETARLQALHSLQLLDTHPDERFDRLTRLAQRLFGVPIALVSLVDKDRQWFKSVQGLAALQTPRNISFCGHAILADTALVVSNAALDMRFADNPLVTGAPHIRFYAGMPLRAPSGHKVGTLCLIDSQPRSFSAQDNSLLADLAAVVNSELDNRGLADAVREAQRIDRMKTEFISTVSHELRTPLTSIQGSLGLIAGGVAGELPVKAKALVGIAKSNCERLIRLINDMLDSAKIESGEMRLDVQKHDMHRLAQQVVEELKGYAAQYAVQVVFSSAGPAWAWVDEDRMAQVLTNLLSNAIKFSPRGGTVALKVHGPAIRNTDNVASIRVEVQDNGPGIDAEFKSRIFQKFSQAHASDNRPKGGTGLGLNIVRALVEKMQGHIGFDSQLGLGSTFYVEMPAWQV